MGAKTKILMIGNTDSGKTTYMASSYGLLNGGKFGFYVHADEDTDRWLNTLYTSIQQGGYPMPTDKRGSFNFDLYYYQQQVLSFEWLDYYGGVINESKSEQLQNDMDNADAIMLFIEAPALLHNQKSITQFRRILYLISNKLMNEERFFNVIIVLTKYDLVGNSAPYDEVCRPLEQFRESISGKGNIYFRIVPVSCTSKGFVNVDLPLIDILHSGLYIRCLSSLYGVQAQEKRFQEYNPKRGFIDWTISRLFGLQTNGEIADAALKEMQKQLELYKQLETPFEKLSQYRQEYQVVIPSLTTGECKKQESRRSRFGSL